jgi:glycosyltransferase involved in cell wall biosynthesis
MIINDSSTDDSEKIILSYTDQRIIYHKHSVNQGVVAAMNHGLERSLGKYVAVMHADDIALPHRLEKQVEFLEDNPAVAVVAGKSIFIDEHNRPTAQVWELDERTTSTTDIKAAMIKESCISHPTVTMRADVVKKYKYQSSPVHKGFAVEDYPLWLHILSDGYKVAKLNEAVLYYRVHSASATGTYLRKKNPFLINYYSKQSYLQQRKASGNFNDFDRRVQRSMYMDFLKAQLKNIKRALVGK